MDKVQKIREEVARIQLYTQSKVLKQVLDYIDEVQKEPVSDTQSSVIFYGLTGSVGSPKEEPVSKELEGAAFAFLNDAMKRSAKTGEGTSLVFAFKAGAQWQKEHLWKSADGDDLPEYEREVVVFTQIFPDDAEMMRVAIGHRPNPEGWDGKSLSTGKVEHYTPKTYDKGGWNIPNIKYFLDVELPKDKEL